MVVDYVTASERLSLDLDLDHPTDPSSEKELCVCRVCIRKYAKLNSYPPRLLDASQVCPKEPWSKTAHEEDPSENEADDAFLLCPRTTLARSCVGHIVFSDRRTEALKSPCALYASSQHSRTSMKLDGEGASSYLRDIVQ